MMYLRYIEMWRVIVELQVLKDAVVTASTLGFKFNRKEIS